MNNKSSIISKLESNFLVRLVISMTTSTACSKNSIQPDLTLEASNEQEVSRFEIHNLFEIVPPIKIQRHDCNQYEVAKESVEH